MFFKIGALALALICSGNTAGNAADEDDRSLVLVGAARKEVTPSEPVVLAGYGGRTTVFEGIDTKLWARAMVIGDDHPVAIVVLDNCGVTRKITSRLAGRLAKHGIAAERLVVAATHTHNAPNLTGYAPIVWAGRATPEQHKAMADYTTFAIEQMEAAVVAALSARKPMGLEWAQGRAWFGGNRRLLNNGKWAGFGFQQDGPSDHSLPVLAARDAGGVVRAVWANYACHCTTVGARNHVGGDWAGFAAESMEKQFPQAISLMTIGCGADVGPQPDGNLEIARKHGGTIGTEVRRLLTNKTTSLSAAPETVSKRVKLPLAKVEDRAHWEEQLKAGSFHGELAKAMLQRLDSGESVPSEVDYPVSAWMFGDDLAMIFLGGEVVVDYSVRLNHELDWSRLWITAWANEMPGYIPSRRVLEEGGYEPDFSQVYYGQPSRYAPELEDVLVGAVHELVGKRFAAKLEQKPAPFHRAPSGAARAFAALAEWAAQQESDGEKAFLTMIRQQAAVASPAIGKLTNPGAESYWYDFAGDSVTRRFIRQEEVGAELRWQTPAIREEGGESGRKIPRVLCFTGGLGWESEPEVGGFGLFVAGQQKLTFDVTREPAHWKSSDGSVALTYLPTWRTGADSGGFFFVVLSEGVPGAGALQVSVRSLGSGSKRWFAIDAKQAIDKNLQRLNKALTAPPAK